MFIVQANGNFNSIPELGNNVARAEEAVVKNVSECDEFEGDSNTTLFDNPPIQSWVWQDHNNKCNYVQVALPIFSGAKDINFKIAEDGNKIYINYTWPSSIFNPKTLFEQELISNDHPKIYALMSQQIRQNITPNSNPRGKITINLPIKVQNEDGTWTTKAIVDNEGARIIVLEFKGYQELIHIKQADTSIKFD